MTIEKRHFWCVTLVASPFFTAVLCKRKWERNLKMLKCLVLAEFLEGGFFFVVDLYQCKKRNFMAEINPEQFCIFTCQLCPPAHHKERGWGWSVPALLSSPTAHSPDFQYASLWLRFFYMSEVQNEELYPSFTFTGIGLIIILVFLKEET